MAKKKNGMPTTKAEWKAHLTQDIINTGMMIVARFLWVLGVKGAYMHIADDGQFELLMDNKGRHSEIAKLLNDDTEELNNKQ